MFELIFVLIAVLLIFILLSVHGYKVVKKTTLQLEKDRQEQQKIQDCLLYLLKKQEFLLETEFTNLTIEECLVLNHCAETICIQLSSQVFDCQGLPHAIAEEYVNRKSM